MTKVNNNSNFELRKKLKALVSQAQKNEYKLQKLQQQELQFISAESLPQLIDIILQQYRDEYEFSGKAVRAIAVDLNNVKWFGGYNGAIRYDGEYWKTFTVDDGLPANDVRSIAADTNGIIWCGTTAGIAVYDGVSWRSFSTEHALANRYVLSIAVPA